MPHRRQCGGGLARHRAVLDCVGDLIPRGGEWFDIYREAITYFSTKDGLRWAAVALANLSIAAAEDVSVEIPLPAPAGSASPASTRRAASLRR